MPARSGADYLRRLKEQPPAGVFIGGEHVKDVTSHPAFRRGALSVAELYDLQLAQDKVETMTYTAADVKGRAGLSFIIPRGKDDLKRRGEMMATWARVSGGIMGRSPDYMNASFAAMAAAAPFFAEDRPEFGEHIQRYYEHIRDNDLTLTHTLINLQRRRSGESVVEEKAADIALQVVEENDGGIVVDGARILATLGPLSDEIAVYPPRSHHFERGTASKYAVAFAIPCSTPGLKFLCRDTFDVGRSHFDHPLASRYEEMDAVVIFDHVRVPWERVFLLHDAQRCNDMPMETNQYLHAGHQVVAKNIAKSEMVVGLAGLMVEALGSEKLPQVQERMAELITTLELQKACLAAAEAEAEIDQWGVMSPKLMPIMVARNMFMEKYPRMVEILQLLGSSSLMALPSEADFASEAGPDLEHYLATDSIAGRDRVRLFRFAWDVALSSFGGRQALYERFFQGDSLRNAILLDNTYPKGQLMDRVREYVERADLP